MEEKNAVSGMGALKNIISEQINIIRVGSGHEYL